VQTNFHVKSPLRPPPRALSLAKATAARGRFCKKKRATARTWKEGLMCAEEGRAEKIARKVRTDSGKNWPLFGCQLSAVRLGAIKASSLMPKRS